MKTGPDNSRILEALDLNELPPEEQEALLLELNELVFRGTMTRLVERMDENGQEAFAKLMESDPPEEAVEAFLRSRVPDADSALTETIQDITDDILAATGTNTK